MPRSDVIAVTDSQFGAMLARHFDGRPQQPIILSPDDSHAPAIERMESLQRVVVVISFNDSGTTSERFARHVVWPISVCHDVLSHCNAVRHVHFFICDADAVSSRDAATEWNAAEGALRGFSRNLRCELKGRTVVTLDHAPMLSVHAVSSMLGDS